MSDLTDRLRDEANHMDSARHIWLVHEAADALDAAEAEIARLRQIVPGEWESTLHDMHLKLWDAEAKLAAIEALHWPVTEAEQPTRYCHHDGFVWPCGTHRILHPEGGESPSANASAVTQLRTCADELPLRHTSICQCEGRKTVELRVGISGVFTGRCPCRICEALT